MECCIWNHAANKWFDVFSYLYFNNKLPPIFMRTGAGVSAALLKI